MAAVLVRVDLGQKPLVKDSDVKSFLQLAYIAFCWTGPFKPSSPSTITSSFRCDRVTSSP